MSVEHLDDVATAGTAGFTVEQAKAGTAKNPIANTSPELWKTFANWLDAIAAGQLDPVLGGLSYRLELVHPNTITGDRNPPPKPERDTPTRIRYVCRLCNKQGVGKAVTRAAAFTLFFGGGATLTCAGCEQTADIHFEA